ncbi:MAG TPA: S9 family peptidase, partial [Vicinamibacterales bacterium]|nr:S9 family peptidase [Vicinamibacterales bacterium]
MARLAFVTLALVAAVQAAPGAQTNASAVDLADYYRVEAVSGTELSPDGRTVAFVRTVIMESENRRHSEIWTVPADGSAAPRRLTSPAFSSTGPRWSPDGRLLAFTSRRPVNDASGPTTESVWFLRMDQPGGEAFEIAGVEGPPVFSPDNKWIAFTKAVPPATARSAPAMTAFETLTEERFKGRVYDWMNARFDGRGYLPDPRDPYATPPQELFVVAREGGTPRQLTTQGVHVQAPSWKADGRALVFTSNMFQRDEYTYERADIFTVDLDGRTTRVTDDGFDHDSAFFAADGSILAIRQQSLNQVLAAKQAFGSATDIYRFPPGGGPPVNLTASWDLIPSVPGIAPEGRVVQFRAGSGGSSHVFRVPLTGGPVEQVTRGDRRVRDASYGWAADRMAYVSGDATHPAEVFVSGLDGSAERKLSGFNDALLATMRLRPVERVRFPSKDGTPIDGWLILPAGAAPDARVPLILAIHGGPHGAYGNDFSLQFQYWAANGLAVLATNPRGSTEYGEKFLWDTWGGWGGKDFEDVMAGVDHVIAHYPVDAKRLGVTGYSYGGFLTNWTITQTPRFAAAIVGAGISNWVSDYGTADIPRTKESEFGGSPWEPKALETLLKWSPVIHAAQVVTPTLFVHGEADLRVPIEEGEQMYTALKKLKVPTKFIRYPESYHTGWSPWNTVHRYQEELRWWRQHLRAAAP